MPGILQAMPNLSIDYANIRKTEVRFASEELSRIAYEALSPDRRFDDKTTYLEYKCIGDILEM